MKDILTKRAVGVALRRHQHALAAGQAVRSYRHARGLSQHELAAQVGISHMTVSRVETGARTIRPRERPVFAHALGVSVAALRPAIGRPQLEVVAGHNVPTRAEAALERSLEEVA